MALLVEACVLVHCACSAWAGLRVAPRGREQQPPPRPHQLRGSHAMDGSGHFDCILGHLFIGLRVDPTARERPQEVGGALLLRKAA